MRTFSPALVVEATTFCDRSCPGCYAPNVLERSAEARARSTEGRFLLPSALALLLDGARSTRKDWDVVGIRGGEPTLNPDLLKIIALLGDEFNEVFLETHGRWIGKSQLVDDLGSLEPSNLWIKISFDSMHGLKGADLLSMTRVLDGAGIKWVVAVTEVSPEAARETLKQVPWLDETRVIFQKLATSPAELVRPRLGVITAGGQWNSDLSAKPGSFSVL